MVKDSEEIFSVYQKIFVYSDSNYLIASAHVSKSPLENSTYFLENPPTCTYC